MLPSRPMPSHPLHSGAGRFRLRDLLPFGPARHPRPRPFAEMAHVVWENRDNLPYAWRILTRGVCDGCSLGPRGLRDDVISGIHLCMTRLRLLRLNTMGPIPDERLRDLGALRALGNPELHRLGRLPYPLIHRAGTDRLDRLSWDEALGIAAEELRDVPGERMGFFATSRGLVNETYYAFQKAARLMGSNHLDLCARLCHAASVAGLKDTLGIPAPTCSLKDMIGADLVVILGSHLANNQPVTTKYLCYAKRQGTRILVVNPMREPGLERYWVPSDLRSSLFGTRLMDDFFQVAVGGDIAFLHGVMKHLIERDAVDRAFILQRTTGLDELEALLARTSWESLEEAAGLSRGDMLRFADQYARARTAVFVYSMGLTQHRFGVDNVKALVNLALARGMLGREKCGIIPIRGHSGVQGGAEMGAYSTVFPGGLPITDENAARLRDLWGFAVPTAPGLTTPQMIDAAYRGELDVPGLRRGGGEADAERRSRPHPAGHGDGSCVSLHDLPGLVQPDAPAAQREDRPEEPGPRKRPHGEQHRVHHEVRHQVGGEVPLLAQAGHRVGPELLLIPDLLRHSHVVLLVHRSALPSGSIARPARPTWHGSCSRNPRPGDSGVRANPPVLGSHQYLSPPGSPSRTATQQGRRAARRVANSSTRRRAGKMSSSMCAISPKS